MSEQGIYSTITISIYLLTITFHELMDTLFYELKKLETPHLNIIKFKLIV